MAYREKDTKKWTAQWFETNVMGEKKKRRKRGFETKREALEFERSKKLSNERSMDMKLSDFIEIYFSDKQNDLKDRTIKNKRYMMQQHIVPYFGNQMMSEIKASQIIQWQNEIQKKGYSDSYLRMIQNQLTSLFTHAAKIYDLPVNPCKKVKRMGNSDSRSLNFWTLDEYKQFIQTMEPGTRYYLMFEMLFWTGCRIGELLAITKADINFEKNQLSINKTYYRTGMQDIITEPKTKQSFRTIEIPEFLKEEIKEFVDGHYGMPDTERLFPVVQEAVQHSLNVSLDNSVTAMIRFQGNDNADKNCERLRREIDFTEGQTFEIVPLEQANGGTIILAVIILAVFISFSGYLLIYNILYVSVVKDVQFYGRLKTIGTTQRQIKRIIYKQAIRISCIGIPIGLLLGAAVSFGM